MNTYYFEGMARQCGAIGITHPFNAEVRAKTLDEAKLKLYDDWEHISISYQSEWPKANKI